jgi:hypothetical protein
MAERARADLVASPCLLPPASVRWCRSPREDVTMATTSTTDRRVLRHRRAKVEPLHAARRREIVATLRLLITATRSGSK